MKTIALIVDDDENNLLLGTDLLEQDDFVVFVAATATLGISAALREKPDIIVMDMRLPDMRGSDAAKVLQDNEVTHHIPIVFVTASVMADGLEELDPFPDSILIRKPINTRTFAKEIRRIVPSDL